MLGIQYSLRHFQRHVQPPLRCIYSGQLRLYPVAELERWISQHYDLESDFYLVFLDKQARCYSHGYFSRDDESLEAAIQRKLDTAITDCGMRPGWRVLDIGAGWGAFTAHAGRQGLAAALLAAAAQPPLPVPAMAGATETRIAHLLGEDLPIRRPPASLVVLSLLGAIGAVWVVMCLGQGVLAGIGM